MSQNKRILIAVVILIVLVGIIVGVDAIRRATSGGETAEGEPTLVPGGIPIRLDGRLVGSFTPGDLEGLVESNFVDAEEGKTQDGWLLKDILLRHLDPDDLKADSTITVSSSSRDKTATVTWAEAEDEENHVMFDLSNQGTLKFVSTLEQLDIRDEWVQVVDSIDISSP